MKAHWVPGLTVVSEGVSGMWPGQLVMRVSPCFLWVRRGCLAMFPGAMGCVVWVHLYRGESSRTVSRRNYVNKGAFFPPNGAGFLNNDNFGKGVIYVGPRRFNGRLLRQESVNFRFETLHASDNISVASLVTFNDGRLRYFLWWGLTICVLVFANVIERIVASVARINDARRNVAGDVRRCVNVQVSRRSFFVFRGGTSWPGFASFSRLISIRAGACFCFRGDCFVGRWEDVQACQV